MKMRPSVDHLCGVGRPLAQPCPGRRVRITEGFEEHCLTEDGQAVAQYILTSLHVTTCFDRSCL